VHLSIANLNSLLTNQSTSPEVKQSAREQLQQIAGNPTDSRYLDARLVLQELGSTDKEQESPQSGDLTPHDEHVQTPDSGECQFEKLFKSLTARDRAFYEKAKADGLTAEQAVERMRREQGIHAASHYGHIAVQAELCRRDGRSAALRYHLPTLYRHLKTIPVYDWPAHQLAEATLAEYLPTSWLTRELFGEMTDLVFSMTDGPSDGLMARKQEVKGRPELKKFLGIKSQFPDSYGLIPDMLNSVLYELTK